MITTRTGSVAAALALTAASTIAAAPAYAAPAAAPTGIVQYADAPGSGSADSGSLDNPIAQAGLLLVAGVGVSIALAVSAGVAGGAFELPLIPGLPL